MSTCCNVLASKMAHSIETTSPLPLLCRISQRSDCCWIDYTQWLQSWLLRNSTEQRHTRLSPPRRWLLWRNFANVRQLLNWRYKNDSSAHFWKILLEQRHIRSNPPRCCLTLAQLTFEKKKKQKFTSWTAIGWLRSVGSIKLQVSFAE